MVLSSPRRRSSAGCQCSDDSSFRTSPTHTLLSHARSGIVPHFAWGVPRWPAIRDMDEAFWQRVIQTNLGGTFLCTKHVLPHMEARRSGHVINLHVTMRNYQVMSQPHDHKIA